MEYSELRHNNQESSRDSSEDQESSGNFIPYSVTQCKNTNKHPPLFAENLIIANSLSSNEYCITNVRI